MKLLIDCIPLSAGGGVQVAIAFLANIQRHAGIEWNAVVPAQIKASLPAHIAADSRLLFLRKSGIADRLWLHWKLAGIEKKFKPDIVFTVFGPAYFQARAPQVVGFALPNMIYDREPGFSNMSPTFEKYLDQLRIALFRKARHIVVETETVRDRLAKKISVDKSKITVIGNSINPYLAVSTPVPPPDAGPFAFLVPSAHYPHKNLEIIPRVAAAMRKLDPDCSFEFRLTLSETSEPWKAIANAADGLGVAQCLRTLGVVPITELASAYNDAHAVFLPTLREASTAVYPESFHFHRPLVTSGMDFAHELCGEAALFIPPRAPDSIASRLIELMGSSDLRQNLVGAGKQQLIKSYPAPDKKFAMQLDVLYAVLGQRRCQVH